MSASDAPQDPRCTAAIEDLQVRLAFFEHTLEQLDEVVRQVADENVRLKRELNDLRERVSSGGEGLLPSMENDPLAEKPPHY